MRILSDEGFIILDLLGVQKNYFVNEMGPFDIVSLPLTKNHSNVITKNPKLSLNLDTNNDYVIAGFPSRHRFKDTLYLSCRRYQQIPIKFSNFWFENQMGTIHLQCNSSSTHLTQDQIFNLTHAEVAGMSGGPVLFQNKVIGVVYHYEEKKQDKESYFKVQLFPNEVIRMPESKANRRYQLDRRLFESVKLPNLILQQLLELVMIQAGLYSYKESQLKDIYWAEDQELHITFLSLPPQNFDEKDLPLSLKNFFEKYLPSNQNY